MLNLNRQCNFCGSSAQGKKMQPRTIGKELVTEVRYICPRCNRYFAKDMLRESKKSP